jgi:putative transposase
MLLSRMPWPERSTVSLRKEFVLRALGKEASFTELCRQHGVSRKTGYKWLQRFKAEGIVGLVDESRRPKTSPTEMTEAMKADIVRLRQAHPTWGGKKLRKLLMKSHGESAPSVRTIERVMQEYGLIRRRRWRERSIAVPSKAPVVKVEAPNDLWTVDFKGWWQTTDGIRCEPLTVRDAHSRYVLALRALPRTKEVLVRPVFEELFRRYGLPKAIQSDNGPPFAHVLSLGGISTLSAWWIALGIHIVRSRPGCPQDNGAHERMHVDVCSDLQARPAPSLLAQQGLFDEWTAEFNHVRPHEAIDLRTPAELYRPSERKLPALVIPNYPKDWHPHHVDISGKIMHRRWSVRVSKVLARHIVAVEERPTECRVWFCNLLLGRYVPKIDRKVSPLPPEVTLPSVEVTASQPPTAAVDERSPLPVDVACQPE